MGFDIAQLSLLLFLTGGLENPFAFLILSPVLLSATALPPRITLTMAGFAVLCATILVFVHYPLPWDSDDPLTLPWIYTLGVWLSILLAIGFISNYSWQITEEGRQLAEAFAATELVLAREQHLTQLDGLAAAAAHELGTPLATIALVVKEMGNLVPKEGTVAEDLDLLAQEVRRCRNILSTIASLDKEGATVINQMTLGHLIEEVVEPHRDFGVEVKVSNLGAAPEPVCRRNPAILYGLGNLVENAVDFAKSEVGIRAEWSAETVGITIEDDGPGFGPDIIQRIGEPYLSSRNDGRRSKSEEGSGLGLGMFIAKTLLERSGAVVTAGNRPEPESGARIEVQWPRATFQRRLEPATEAPPARSREEAKL